MTPGKELLAAAGAMQVSHDMAGGFAALPAINKKQTPARACLPIFVPLASQPIAGDAVSTSQRV
jgi:hypothetical protein